MKQFELAERLGISVSYLSQIENDDRPLTAGLVDELQSCFPLDWQLSDDEDDTLGRAHSLREALSDPLFGASLDIKTLTRFSEQHGDVAERFIELHAAYRQLGERLQMLDEAMTSNEMQSSRLPWEEVRDWFHMAGNYVDTVDRAAEGLARDIAGDHTSPSTEKLIARLSQRHGVEVEDSSSGQLREFDSSQQHLLIDNRMPVETRRFQIAHQLATLELEEELHAVTETAEVNSPSARQLLYLGLANYAAASLLMPYDAFRRDARTCRHDIDRLRSLYGVSFEQACHRLSTLQRRGARGIPVFFCRVDMAGNITKRHSATRLQFARFGGACPLWIVHEAVAIPDRILVQLGEMPDGVRYVSMAKGLVKPSGSYDRLPRRYAVALGCEVEHASEFVYADDLAIEGGKTATPIGASCRTCPRETCDQRAFPPSDRALRIDSDRRGVVPYQLG